MTVNELIEKLQNLNPNLEVVMSEYDLPHGPWGFVHVKTVQEDAISIGSIDKNFAHIYSGDWLDQE